MFNNRYFKKGSTTNKVKVGEGITQKIGHYSYVEKQEGDNLFVRLFSSSKKSSHKVDRSKLSGKVAKVIVKDTWMSDTVFKTPVKGVKHTGKYKLK